MGNQLLAWSQLQGRGMGLAPIATYKRWSELGRQVKKGEKAIALVMPVTISKKDGAGEKTGEVFSMFTLKNNWFTLDQTEGADYVNEIPVPNWDKCKALETLQITEVRFDSPNGNSQGYAQGKNIAINPKTMSATNPPAVTTPRKTLSEKRGTVVSSLRSGRVSGKADRSGTCQFWSSGGYLEWNFGYIQVNDGRTFEFPSFGNFARAPSRLTP
jgi:hypothetical protein